MTFNEMQRELIRRKIDPNVGFVFTVIYERMIEQQKQIDETAKMLLQMVNSLQGLVTLREQDQEALQRLFRESGIQVQSVANEPEE